MNNGRIAVLTVHAPAKVNLVLEVLGKSGDYHRISSIVQTVGLFDVLRFELDEDIRFRCETAGLERDNLVPRAAALVKSSTGYTQGARIHLRKGIPWGAGLGGGSSDAAATLLALNELWGLRLSPDELLPLASKLGSDVSFFMHGGTVLVEGRGHKVSPLPSLAEIYFVLLVPPLPKVAAKTKQMYGRLNASHFTDGRFVRAALSSLKEGAMIEPGLMFNAFEQEAPVFFAGLDRYIEAMKAAGAPRVYLAGSGPCLFAVCSEEDKARELHSRLSSQGLECYLAPSVSGAVMDTEQGDA